MNFHVTNYSCTLAYYSHSRSRPFSSRRSFYRRRHVRALERRIKKIECQLKLNCEETTAQQSRVSLKQLQRRVEKIEYHLKKQNQEAKVKLSTKHCLKLHLYSYLKLRTGKSLALFWRSLKKFWIELKQTTLAIVISVSEK